MSTSLPSRVFKTAWFTKAARKARIGDAELCLAIQQVMVGQADDLGGGVFKKRLNENMHRSIIVAKGGRYWALVSEVDTGLRNGDLLEICDDG